MCCKLLDPQPASSAWSLSRSLPTVSNGVGTQWGNKPPAGRRPGFTHSSASSATCTVFLAVACHSCAKPVSARTAFCARAGSHLPRLPAALLLIPASARPWSAAPVVRYGIYGVMTLNAAGAACSLSTSACKDFSFFTDPGDGGTATGIGDQVGWACHVPVRCLAF